MDASPEDIIRGELDSGEQLLWAGRPPQGLVLWPADLFLIPFCLLWGGGVLLLEALVIASGAPWQMALAGLPFVLVGLYLLAGRFWIDAKLRSRICYGVTSERILIVAGLWRRRVQSRDLNSIREVSMTARRSGAGTIRFVSVPWLFRGQIAYGWMTFAHETLPCFELPGEVPDVYEIIRGAKAAAQERARVRAASI